MSDGYKILKTLLISDLDGTLLTSRECVSPYSMEHLNTWIDGGLSFTYATARSLNSAAKACWGLRQNLPVILYNGAIVMQPQTRTMLYHNPFNEGQLWFLKGLFDKYDIWPLVYSFCGAKERVSWVVGKETEGVRRYLERRKGDVRLNPVAQRRDILGDDIFYFNCIGSKEQLEGLRAEVEHSFDIKCIYARETYQSDYWCEIMPRSTSKGEAARQLKGILGAEKLVVFGDGVNDIDLFGAADESYAVKNADEKLKEMATAVIGYSEEDGVVKYIAENLKKYL